MIKNINTKLFLLLLKKFNLLILLVFLLPFLLYAQVKLEIHPDFLVQTKNNVSVQINGNLIEDGSGYFSGIIKSGPRTSVSTFAGLTLSKGMNGNINRITGKSYAKGNGEFTNFKRYYEIGNKNGNNITADISIDCVTSGKNNESNGISPPFYIYGYSTEWKGYGEGNSTPPDRKSVV